MRVMPRSVKSTEASGSMAPVVESPPLLELPPLELLLDPPVLLPPSPVLSARPLLPLLPFADGKLLPAMLLLLVVGVAYYPAYLPVECATEPLLIGAVGALDGLLVIVSPTVLLLRARRGAPS